MKTESLIKTKAEVKAFFERKMDDRKAWMDTVRGRSSRLESRDVRVATLKQVFSL